MITNLREVLAQLDRDMDLPDLVVGELHRGAHRDMVAGSVEQTPVDPDRGEARGGMVSSIGSPTDATTGRLDLTGAETILENEKVIQQIRPYSVSYGQNNVPHFRILELGLFNPADPGPSKDPRPGRKGRILVSGAFSTQAPRGVIGITFDRVDLKYKMIAERGVLGSVGDRVRAIAAAGRV